MCRKNIILLSILLVGYVNGFLKRDVSQASHPSILEPVKQNINQFRKCLDQSLATVVDNVNLKQLEPAFEALGDQLNRFSKAFDVLTAPSQKLPPVLGS